MTKMLQVRLAMALIGTVVWGYGVAVDDSRLRLIGMAFLAASLVLRFVRRPRRDGDKAT